MAIRRAPAENAAIMSYIGQSGNNRCRQKKTAAIVSSGVHRESLDVFGTGPELLPHTDREITAAMPPLVIEKIISSTPMPNAPSRFQRDGGLQYPGIKSDP